MKYAFIIFFILITIASCRSRAVVNNEDIKKATNNNSARLSKYYLLIDGTEKTESGFNEVDKLDSIFCSNDNDAIVKGIYRYYDAVVSIETRIKGMEPPLPYLVHAKGWAILNANGDEIKNCVTPQYIDSIMQRAADNANRAITNTAFQ